MLFEGGVTHTLGSVGLVVRTAPGARSEGVASPGPVVVGTYGGGGVAAKLLVDGAATDGVLVLNSGGVAGKEKAMQMYHDLAPAAYRAAHTITTTT